MTTAGRAVFALAVVLSGAIIIAALTSDGVFGWAQAPLLMPVVLVFTLLYRPLPRGRVLVPLIGAQVFSFLGDLFLSRWVDNFVVGVGMFLIAQVFYIVTFLGIRGEHQLRRTPLLAVPYVLYLIGMMVVVLPKAGELALPLVVYGVCLLGMAAAAVDTRPRVPARAWQLLTVGSILFVLSDTSIALRKFEILPDSGLTGAWVIGTYCVAQLMLAVGVLTGAAGAGAATADGTAAGQATGAR